MYFLKQGKKKFSSRKPGKVRKFKNFTRVATL